MYISINWLKDFVKIPAKIKPAEIAAEMTRHTVEVEGFIEQAKQYENVVVGQVLEVDKHPNADRLRLAVVDIKKKKLHIVCGAPNLEVGQLVPVALVGAILPNGLEIKESEIRGQKSEGMICAEDELGLGSNHEGIIVLKDGAKIGQSFAAYLAADDIILEVDNKSLSNRPDLWSHYGLGRELAAIFDLPLRPYSKFADYKFSKDGGEKGLEVKVEDKKLCPRYMAVKIDNINISESPAWLKQRLIAVKQRPINNIVDLTNYVMLECGQPLHAFNADKVQKIVVRRADKGEGLETLDEKERVLETSDLVIADGKKAIALAGIMGGRESGVNLETKSIILESANFTAGAVRQTSQRLGLRSEASARFEKSLDPRLTEEAMKRFLSLLKKVCPEAKVGAGPADINSAEEKKLVIDFDLAWLSAKIGQEIPRSQVIKILEKLGFIVKEEKENILAVTVPSWRATKDITIREDLAEEVLRLYGYNQISSQSLIAALRLPDDSSARLLERKIRRHLSLKASLAEAYNYSFVGADQLTKLGVDFSNYLRLANPLAETQTMLRQSLAPGLVLDIKNNQAKADDLGFFELGNVFFNTPGNIHKEAAGEETLPHQEKHLGLALAGGGDLFGRLKGLIANLLENAVRKDIEIIFSPLELRPGWADERTVASLNILGKEIGIIAALGEEAARNFNLKKPVVIAEINFTILAELSSGLPVLRFQEENKYPPVIRDLAFVVSEKILYNDLKAELRAFSSLIQAAEVFDVYSGDRLEDGQKSLAFHLFYQAPERTLRAEEIDELQKQMVAHLADKFGAKLRDF